MITSKEKKRIKEFLGRHYSSMIQEELHKKGIRNQNGLPHTANMIRQVMNGNREHREIETAIFDAVQTQKELKKIEEYRRNLILEQTKTGGTTPA